MGSPDRPEAPLHDVTLTSGYWISRVPVTQALWREVIGRRYRSRDDEPDDLPVDGVTWDFAVSFSRSLTQRLRDTGQLGDESFCALPTEAQWEYACRAGTTSRWYFGDDESLLENHAWFADNSSGVAHPVATKQANPWGIHDLYGNVSEWCVDDDGDLGPGHQVDPLCIMDGLMKVTRGGSYADGADQCDSVTRRPLLPANPFTEESGIRIVVNATSRWIDRPVMRDLGFL